QRMVQRDLGAVPGALGGEELEDLGVLVLVLDLPTALFLAEVGTAGVVHGVAVVEPAEGVGEVTSARRAGVEVLVVLVVARGEQAALLPVDLDGLVLTGEPEQRVAGPAQDDDLGAGAVTMGLLVRASRELAHVGGH